MSSNTNATLIRNVRPFGRTDAVDIRVRDGRIASIDATNAGHASDEQATETVIDGAGRLAFPGFVDAHGHIDKSLLGMGWNRNEVGPSLIEKIDNERNMRRDRGIDLHQQSGRSARASIATGVTHLRTFVDIDTENGLAGLHGVVQTQADLQDALTMQIVAFPQSGMLIRPGTVELLEQALQEGATVIGGLDPCIIDRDPAGHLDVIFGLAEKYDVDVDIHLHEPGEVGAFSLELIAERTKVLGWQGRVVVSHGICLGGVEDAYLNTLIDLLLENDIVVMSHGPSGLHKVPSVKRLREAGVRMCTGNDGIRDAWGPLNMPDMLLRSFIIAYRNNLRRDDEIEMVLDIATRGGAEVIGDADYGLAVGNWADLVLLEGETHIEAVIERPKERLVMRRGVITARDGAYVGAPA